MNSGPEVMACVPECTAFIILIENDDVLINDQISKWREDGQETTQIYLKHELSRDLYITLNGVSTLEDGEHTATITVREIPGIILVWLGSLLTITGMLLTMFTEWKSGQEWLRNISKKVPDH